MYYLAEKDSIMNYLQTILVFVLFNNTFTGGMHKRWISLSSFNWLHISAPHSPPHILSFKVHKSWQGIKPFWGWLWYCCKKHPNYMSVITQTIFNNLQNIFFSIFRNSKRPKISCLLCISKVKIFGRILFFGKVL